MSPEELAQIAAERDAADLGSDEFRAAINKLVEANLPLVAFHVNRKYKGKESVKHLDLMQAGYEGLIRAAEGWNPEKGAFSTYGILWISAKETQYYRRSKVVNARHDLKDTTVVLDSEETSRVLELHGDTDRYLQDVEDFHDVENLLKEVPEGLRKEVWQDLWGVGPGREKPMEGAAVGIKYGLTKNQTSKIKHAINHFLMKRVCD